MNSLAMLPSLCFIGLISLMACSDTTLRRTSLKTLTLAASEELRSDRTAKEPRKRHVLRTGYQRHQPARECRTVPLRERFQTVLACDHTLQKWLDGNKQINIRRYCFEFSKVVDSAEIEELDSSCADLFAMAVDLVEQTAALKLAVTAAMLIDYEAITGETSDIDADSEKQLIATWRRRRLSEELGHEPPYPGGS